MPTLNKLKLSDFKILQTERSVVVATTMENISGSQLDSNIMHLKKGEGKKI